MENLTWDNVTAGQSQEHRILAESLMLVSPIGKAALILAYSTVIVLSVGGNSLVIISILATEHMRTITNYFILNLACADILMAVMCIPFTFVANVLLFYWPFGTVMCPLVTYGQAVSVFLSAFTLIAISLDRHRAIRHPLRPRLTYRQLTAIVASIWAVAVVLPVPVAIVSRVNRKPDSLTGSGSGARDLCEEVWPNERLRSGYSILIMVWQYFLPVFVLTFTYASIGYAIWWKKTPGEPENGRDQRMAASKRKMVKMMVNVVLIYGVCWLPLHTITLVGDMTSSVWRFRYIQVVWIGAHWLAMSNCCYNPIVYWWMSSNFRDGFRSALGCPPPSSCARSGTGGRGGKGYYTPPPPPSMGRGGAPRAMLARGATVETVETARTGMGISQRSTQSL